MTNQHQPPASTALDGVFRRAFAVFADRSAVTSEEGSQTCAELRERAWRAHRRAQRAATQTLSGYNRPRFVEFVASERIPRSATGKLQRYELAKWPIGEDQQV